MKPKVELDKVHWDPKKKRTYEISSCEIPCMPFYQRLWIRLKACTRIMLGLCPCMIYVNLRKPYWKDNDGWKATYNEFSIYWERIVPEKEENDLTIDYDTFEQAVWMLIGFGIFLLLLLGGAVYGIYRLVKYIWF